MEPEELKELTGLMDMQLKLLGLALTEIANLRGSVQACMTLQVDTLVQGGMNRDEATQLMATTLGGALLSAQNASAKSVARTLYEKPPQTADPSDEEADDGTALN